MAGRFWERFWQGTYYGMFPSSVGSGFSTGIPTAREAGGGAVGRAHNAASQWVLPRPVMAFTTSVDAMNQNHKSYAAF